MNTHAAMRLTGPYVVEEFLTEADAHLIAAAPEMYAMLNSVCYGLLDAGGAGNCRLAMDIEKLLAKARGEA